MRKFVFFITLTFIMVSSPGAEILILPYRVKGDTSQTKYSKKELSTAFMQLSRYYAEKNIKTDFSPREVSNELVKNKAPEYWNQLSRKKLKGICQSTETDKVIAAEAFFSGNQVYWNGIFYNCHSGYLSFKTKSKSASPLFLKGFYQFNKKLFRAYPAYPKKENPKTEKEEIILILDSSSKNLFELQHIKDFFKNKIYNIDFTKYSLTFLNINPSGNNLYYHLNDADNRIELFFRKIHKGGMYRKEFPLRKALDKIYFNRHSKGQIFLFTSSYPKKTYLQNLIRKQIIQLYRQKYRFNSLILKNLKPEALRYYKSLVKLGGGKIIPLTYTVKLVNINTDTSFLSYQNNSFYISRSNPFEISTNKTLKNLSNEGQLSPLYIPYNYQGNSDFSFAINYLENKQGKPFLQKYPLQTNLHYILSKIIRFNKELNNILPMKQYLIKSSGQAFWIKCAVNCEKLDKIAPKKPFYLGLSLRNNTPSNPYFSNNPYKISIKTHIPHILLKDFNELLRNQEFYQNYGFGENNPMWFIKARKLAEKNNIDKDIRE